MKEEIKNRLLDELTGNPSAKWHSSEVEYESEPLIQMSDDEVIEYAFDHFPNQMCRSRHNTTLAFDIINRARRGEIRLIKSMWCDGGIWHRPDEQPQLEQKSNGFFDWTSYEGCHDVSFLLTWGNWTVCVEVYNGDNFDGSREDLKCKYLFEVKEDSECHKFLMDFLVRPKTLCLKAQEIIKKIEEDEYQEYLNKAKKYLSV